MRSSQSRLQRPGETGSQLLSLAPSRLQENLVGIKGLAEPSGLAGRRCLRLPSPGTQGGPEEWEHLTCSVLILVHFYLEPVQIRKVSLAVQSLGHTCSRRHASIWGDRAGDPSLSVPHPFIPLSVQHLLICVLPRAWRWARPAGHRLSPLKACGTVRDAGTRRWAVPGEGTISRALLSFHDKMLGHE